VANVPRQQPADLSGITRDLQRLRLQLAALERQMSLAVSVDDFTGDAGAGGEHGLVPAPAAGDAAASLVLGADGTWTSKYSFGVGYGLFQSTGTVTYNSTTWTGIHNSCTLSDIATSGVSRSSSTFTFTDAGRWRFTLETVLASGSNVGFAIRARVGGATVDTSFAFAFANCQTPQVAMSLDFTVTAGGTMTLEYAVGSNSSSLGGGTIDGETFATSSIRATKIA
jgi:hypothetical protein